MRWDGLVAYFSNDSFQFRAFRVFRGCHALNDHALTRTREFRIYLPAMTESRSPRVQRLLRSIYVLGCSVCKPIGRDRVQTDGTASDDSLDG